MEISICAKKVKKKKKSWWHDDYVYVLVLVSLYVSEDLFYAAAVQFCVQ